MENIDDKKTSRASQTREKTSRPKVWAPPGFASFPEEIWCVLLPIYGLTMSAKIFLSMCERLFSHDWI